MRSATKIQASDSPTKYLFNQRDIFIINHSPPFPIRANRLIESLNENIIFPPKIELPPPWTIHRVHTCTHMYFISKKAAYSNEQYKQLTIEHIREKGTHFAIYTDGSKSQMGVGFAAVSSSQNILLSLPNRASVFTAELCAIWSATKIIKGMPSQKFVIYTDSRSAIEALQNYNSKNYLVQQIKYIFHKLKETGKNIELCWVPAHVGIRGNEEADRAAKAAIAMTKANIKIPISDFLPTLKSFIFNKWQTLWNEEPETNKLKQIKLEVTPWETSQQKDRYTEVVLTRLRIGHTRLTHGYLMSNPHEPIPECSQCKSALTVEHFCPSVQFSTNNEFYVLVIIA